MRHHDFVDAIAIEIGGIDQHWRAIAEADPVIRPRSAQTRRFGAWILEPSHAGHRAKTVAQQHVVVSVAIHVFDDERHDPAGVRETVELPVTGPSRVGRRFEPPDGCALVLAADDEVEAAPPIDIHGNSEHPLRSIRVESLGAPFILARIAGDRRCPVHLDSARAALGGADDVEVAVAIGVEEDSVFGVGGLAGRDDAPRRRA